MAPAFLLLMLAAAPSVPTAAQGLPAAPEVGAPPPSAVSEPQPIWLVPAAHSAGVLLGMRLSLSILWPDSFDPTRVRENLAQFRVGWSSPPDFRPGKPLFESDGDPWQLNLVGHGLFGSEVYGRMRRCGHGPLASSLVTAAVSSTWEYGIEAFHKRPSAIDLAWTPVAGVALGEARFQLHRLVLRKLEKPGLGRSALLFLVDPLGELERGLLGTRC